MKRSDLRAAYANPNVFALCAAIDLGEHGKHADDPDRYRTLYGGEKFDAPPWEHPHRKVNAAGITSTAAGRGQFLAGTWDDVDRIYDFPDFSPDCQDEAMVALIIRRGALADVLAGDFEKAISRCAHEWASLPGSPYGQPTITMEQAKARYLERGGQLAPAFNPDTLETEHYEAPQEKPMIPIVPLLTAFGPELVKLIPQFASLFGSGSEVQVRNAKAAEAAVSAVVEATQSPNLQAAIEKMQADPEAAKAAQIAAADVLSLVEIGGGIVEARKANAAASQVPILQDRAFLISLLLFSIPVMLLVDVFYVHPASYDGNLRTQIVTACLLVISILGGFWLGSSFGSHRKNNLIANKE